jgi:hypothetical protein
MSRWSSDIKTLSLMSCSSEVGRDARLRGSRSIAILAGFSNALRSDVFERMEHCGPKRMWADRSEDCG